MKSLLFLINFLPLFVFGETKIKNIIQEVHTIAFMAIKLLIAMATVVFIWGIIKYILYSNDTKKATEAKQFMLWGVIGLFTIVAMWGLVLVIQKTFNLGPGTDDPNEIIPNWRDIPR